jgi:hypothetical protein
MNDCCYFYVDYTGVQQPNQGKVWPLCYECGKQWEGAMFWAGGYGPWEYRCHNPLCSTPGGKLIWEGVTDSTTK